MIKECIAKLVEGKTLTRDECAASMEEIMTGTASPSQIAALITALRIKGETPEEISGFAFVMRKHAEPLNLKSRYFVDTCGTGGDVSGTFNISTVASFVAAGAGVTVAKHGNRAVSSSCGSADLLEALGVNIDIAPQKVAEAIDNIGIGFIFAPVFHKAMRFAAPTRREIGIRTVFNLLGPVTNPANTKGQLMGVYSEHLASTMAYVLKDQGCQDAIVVHGMDGLDEISVSSRTKVAHLESGIIKEYFISPQDFGLQNADIKELSGGTPETNAKICLSVLSGHDKGAKRDITVMNAAAAIIVGRRSRGFTEAVQLAVSSIDSGAAMKKLDDLRDFTKR